METMRYAKLALILAATLAACDNGAGPDAGRLTGRLDGEAWNGAAVIGIGPADGSVLVSEIQSGPSTHRIMVDLNAWTPGTYPIQPGGGWYERSGRGFADPLYREATAGTLVITRVDGDKVVGTLEVTFGSGAEAIHFRDGAFEATQGRRYF